MKRPDEAVSRFPYDPDFFTPQDIRSVDLVRVAALLLGPDDDDYANAALRALQLIDACANVLRRNRKRSEAAKIREQKLAAAGVEGRYATAPFNKAIRIVTGEKRKDRAETAFLTYIEATMSNATKKQLVAEYSRAEEHGFTGQELLAMQSNYNALREKGGLAGKKRRRRSARVKK